MRAPGTYSRSLARPHAPPRALESLTDTRTLNHRSGWAAFTCNGHEISRNLPVGRTTLDHAVHVSWTTQGTSPRLRIAPDKVPPATRPPSPSPRPDMQRRAPCHSAFVTRAERPQVARTPSRKHTPCHRRGRAIRTLPPGASVSYEALDRPGGRYRPRCGSYLRHERATIGRRSGWMVAARRRSPCAPGSRQASWSRRISIDLRRQHTVRGQC